MSKALELLAARLEKIENLKIYTENLPSLKKINVDSLKTSINRYFEDLWREKFSYTVSKKINELSNSDQEVPVALREIYYINTVQLHTVNSCTKQFNKIDKDFPGHPYSEICAQAREIIAQLTPYVATMGSLKNRLEYEKGLPKEAKDPVLKLPAPALASIRRIEGELRNNITQIRAQIKQGALESKTKSLEVFLARPLEERKRNCFRNNLSFGQYLSPLLDNTDGYYHAAHNATEKIAELAESHAEAVINDYISKHSYKLAAIIEKMPDVASIVVDSRSRVNCVEGDTYLTFESGKSFRVFSQIVQVWNVETPFVRYPTTFHDVKNADGSHFGTLVSLEEMIKWANDKKSTSEMTM